MRPGTQDSASPKTLQAYSDILKLLPLKIIKKISDKNSDIFQIYAQNIDCGFWIENWSPKAIYFKK